MLAKELGMTRRQLLDNTDSVELTQWMIYFKKVHEELGKPKDDTVKTETPRQEIGWQKIRYKMRDRQLSREE